MCCNTTISLEAFIGTLTASRSEAIAGSTRSDEGQEAERKAEDKRNRWEAQRTKRAEDKDGREMNRGLENRTREQLDKGPEDRRKSKKRKAESREQRGQRERRITEKIRERDERTRQSASCPPRLKTAVLPCKVTLSSLLSAALSLPPRESTGSCLRNLEVLAGLIPSSSRSASQ